MLFLTMIIATSAYADKTHTTHYNDYYSGDLNITFDSSDVSKPVDNSNTSGVALGIAATQHHFDFGTYKWQGSLGLGRFENNTAISIGIAKRLKDEDVMINGSFGMENGRTGGGIGLNGRF